MSPSRFPFSLTFKPVIAALVLAAPAFCAVAPLPCLAAEPQAERLAYTIMLGGLHVGDAMVSLEQTPDGYKAGLKMTASGALRWVKDFRSSMESEGALKPDARPAFYQREWATDDVAETMTMHFDPATRVATAADRVFNPKTGAILTHEDVPWNKHTPLKAVPGDMRTNVFDPMGAFVAARAQLLAQGALAPQAAGKPFRLPVFDGSRRYDIVGKTDAPKSVNINGVDQMLLPATGHLEPVFGFARESDERMRATEGKIYFTTDGRFVPAQIIVSGEIFTAVMNLAGDCQKDDAPCAAIAAAFTPVDGQQRAQAP